MKFCDVHAGQVIKAGPDRVDQQEVLSLMATSLFDLTHAADQAGQANDPART